MDKIWMYCSYSLTRVQLSGKTVRYWTNWQSISQAKENKHIVTKDHPETAEDKSLRISNSHKKINASLTVHCSCSANKPVHLVWPALSDPNSTRFTVWSRTDVCTISTCLKPVGHISDNWSWIWGHLRRSEEDAAVSVKSRDDLTAQAKASACKIKELLQLNTMLYLILYNLY